MTNAKDQFVDLVQSSPPHDPDAPTIEEIVLKNHETLAKLDQATLDRMTAAMYNPHDVFAKDEFTGLADKEDEDTNEI